MPSTRKFTQAQLDIAWSRLSADNEPLMQRSVAMALFSVVETTFAQYAGIATNRPPRTIVAELQWHIDCIHREWVNALASHYHYSFFEHAKIEPILMPDYSVTLQPNASLRMLLEGSAPIRLYRIREDSIAALWQERYGDAQPF